MKNLETIKFTEITPETSYFCAIEQYERVGTGYLTATTGTGAEVLDMIKDTFCYDPDEYHDLEDFLGAAEGMNGDGWDFIIIYKAPM